ncbi:methyltransferase, TIGR04325 family [Paraburkholderia sp. SARCC-3016]|uniref:methyltransferase, TIGR04325 family n=1 Tax=Paraburkholderia sp. SARCC-3016 TaxID=3058611 RepID=UPI0028097A0C|nr:methyltransferase, TIGR04325 family [Paraburkholderia sp. SARCC-3016]MDQ7979876.1 methyltransferase, TIGR04325 family [Paraburkholderia sp. SARCC-3016]
MQLIQLRDKQIVWTAKFIRILGAIGYGRSLLEKVGRTHAGATLFRSMLGYRSSFQTLNEAEMAVKPYAKGGHENPTNFALHLELNRVARPSDYAAFYYLRDRVAGVRKVFDLGGNVGNLYYCYKDYLKMPEDLIWSVYDLPETVSRGRILASTRNAKNLQFTGDLGWAANADLFIASGSLHYFDKSLPHLLEGVGARPKYILINRAPLTEGPEFAVVQDAGHIRVACMLYNRSKLLADFARLGYGLLGEWQAAELCLPVLDRPSSTIRSYTGLWLERQ